MFADRLVAFEEGMQLLAPPAFVVSKIQQDALVGALRDRDGVGHLFEAVQLFIVDFLYRFGAVGGKDTWSSQYDGKQRQYRKQAEKRFHNLMNLDGELVVQHSGLDHEAGAFAES